VKSIAFFNNKGGVGKTTLVYHLAWTFRDLGKRVVVADLDPQANATAAFVDEDRLEEIWDDKSGADSIYEAVQPIIEGTGDLKKPSLEQIESGLSLIVGDLSLSSLEDELSQQWSKCLDGDPRAFRVESAFWRIMSLAADEADAEIVLIDVGPNLGSINRAALIAADFVVVPLSSDLYSLQGLRNLGPTLRKWREQWNERLAKKPSRLSLNLPRGQMAPIGYIVLQHAVRLDRPVKAYERWIARIPGEYQSSVLDDTGSSAALISEDRNCLALLKHYRSLMPLAQEARKPMFRLTAADGALGAHAQAAIQAGKDFRTLAKRIASRTGIDVE